MRTTPRECASPSTATARKRLRSDALLMGFTWRYEGSSRKARRELERGVAAALPGHAMISEPLGFALVRHTRLDFPLASRHPGRTPLALCFQLGVLCMNAARVLRVLDGCIGHARVRHRATVRTSVDARTMCLQHVHSPRTMSACNGSPASSRDVLAPTHSRSEKSRDCCCISCDSDRTGARGARLARGRDLQIEGSL